MSGFSRNKTWTFLLILTFILLPSAWFVFFRADHTPPAQAAVFWDENYTELSVQSKTPTVCFAGDAVQKRLDRIKQIVQHIKEFEYAANIQFMSMANRPLAFELGPDGDINNLRCPDPVPAGENLVYYGGDIRVALPKTSAIPGDDFWGSVPGEGCETDPNPEGASWSNPPWVRNEPKRRACLYNLKLLDTVNLNFTLHEFGHALGLAHEQQRSDVDKSCTADDYGGEIKNNLMTPYDRDSVMHYAFPTCGIVGADGDYGLTEWDKLALHIMYPEDNQVAEFVGTTVIPNTEQLSLRSAWLARGANIDVVASNFEWRINGEVYTGPTLEIDLGAGEYTLEFSHQDFLGREYSYTGPVQVLDIDDYNAQIVAPIAAELPLLYPNHVIVPTIDVSLQPDVHVGMFFPSDTFDEPIIIDYATQSEIPYPTDLNPIGLFYEIQATTLANGQPAEVKPSKTYQVTIDYKDSSLPATINENDLALHYYENGQWKIEESSTVDVGNKRITASPNHFSAWAVLATQQTHQLYLPMAIR